MLIKKKENQLQSNNGKFSLSPRSLEEAFKFAEILSKSDLVPRDYKGKPDNIFVAIQMGSEIGLAPIQSLQNIAVINGRPSVWGDAAIALVLSHPDCEDIQESVENSIATCRVKRRGHEWHTSTFSMDDARKANLWGKAGPWTNYPQVMLKQRARGFALRDKFSDALKGLITAEEAQDYPNVIEVEEIKEVLMRTDHLIELRELIKEAGVTEEKVASSTGNKFAVGSLSQSLDIFPDKAFEYLEIILKKKIQHNSEKEIDENQKDINLEILNAG